VDARNVGELAGEPPLAVAAPWYRVPRGRSESSAFDAWFAALFQEQFRKLFRYLVRLSGDRDLAADVAQDTFVRLYRRGTAPDSPAAWLVVVGTNLLRNAQSQRSRRLRLLTAERSRHALGDAPRSPEQLAVASDVSRQVRQAIDRMPEREARMLLLMAEGYSYRDIAAALGINQASVGTLLARAKRTFRRLYEETGDAP
jgi:RNA polymerase sigma factor (sigma-70 family)